jgi:hypothetical protein
MASKLPQLQTKLAQASQYATKHGGAWYKQLLEQNKQYIQEPPTIEKCQKLANELFYTRLARFLFLGISYSILVLLCALVTQQGIGK